MEVISFEHVFKKNILEAFWKRDYVSFHKVPIPIPGFRFQNGKRTSDETSVQRRARHKDSIFGTKQQLLSNPSLLKTSVSPIKTTKRN
ncbi:hypothetical protein IGI04_025892 [Brassica rapa subsp. trilocularis]|uniref:Uncharacterized protein n=1 Tax=Brassica rapa subsp. trilocularis TaxID=1813537 RepID=A0ABQ7KX43_BRACM|nr:hypothetical protein IGI04_025892 [Brassica rapa subsp. trilocularis]